MHYSILVLFAQQKRSTPDVYQFPNKEILYLLIFKLFINIEM